MVPTPVVPPDEATEPKLAGVRLTLVGQFHDGFPENGAVTGPFIGTDE
jgi:hypothetical protein